MQMLRSFRKAFCVLALALWPVLAWSQTVALDGATFGYQRPVPLRASIGVRAVPTLRVIRGVGGVAFVREAAGLDGWTVQRMSYDAQAPDGSRVTALLLQRGSNPIEIRLGAWDWEVVPLARFVNSPTDSAFTYFGELPPGVSRTVANARVVSYHPAFENTLMGLRLMQLDLFLFQPPFSGYFTDKAGAAILGGGERPTFGRNINPADPLALKQQREVIQGRVANAMHFLEEDCKRSLSNTCRESGQPFESYIIGDMISPVAFTVQNGAIAFRDRGLCWDFSRETDPGETPSRGLEGIRLLRPLSEAFCNKAAQEWDGIHSLVYRTGRRAMRFAALMRHYKAQDRAGFTVFADSMRLASPRPVVSTPTEVAIKTALTAEDRERLRRTFERLRQQGK